MKILIIILIGGAVVWMFYDLAFKHRGKEKENYDILRDIDKRDKWYDYKLKLKILCIILLSIVVLLVIWLIIRSL
jgi:Na+/H+ antiporter NhaC